MRRPNYSPEEKAALLKDYMDYIDPKELSKKYNTNLGSIYKTVERIGFETLLKLGASEIAQVRSNISAYPLDDLCKHFNAPKREFLYLLKNHPTFSDCWLCNHCGFVKEKSHFHNLKRYYKRYLCKPCENKHHMKLHGKAMSCPVRRAQIGKKRAEYARQRRKNDIKFRMLSSLRSRVRSAIKHNSKSAKTIELLGCSVEDLKRHVEKQFTINMSWDNYGKWELDHLTPCAAFDLSDPEQQRKCFHFSNLQPLWKTTKIAIAHGESPNYVGNVNKRDRILPRASGVTLC